MGLQDSTKTRVEPFFDELMLRDETGVTWLPRLIALPARASATAPHMRPAPFTRSGWGDAEIALPAPKDLLVWLVKNATLCDVEAHQKTSPSTRAKRDLLLTRNAATIAEALACLSRDPLPARGWYILEGSTRPDVYLENENVIVVIEGKRTEPDATTRTTWMSTRHQMLRHLDCAWERRAGRDIFGFFIVEGGGGENGVAVPPAWQAAVDATVKTDALAASLPHRTAREREAIASRFLGATTWQRVCQEFDVSWSDLPETVRST